MDAIDLKKQIKITNNLLSDFSIKTWEELYYSKHSSRLLFNHREDKFTSELVSELAKKSLKTSVNLRMFLAANEKVNGNDIEILIECSTNQYILFPCQAKKIFPSEKYESLSHPDKKTKEEQILKLLEYAKIRKGVPLYLFYNYSDSTIALGKYSQKELFGCTFLSAHYVKDNFYDFSVGKLRAMNFIDIHPPAIPIISIVDILGNPDFQATIMQYINIESLSYTLLPRTKSQLENDIFWHEINPSRDNEVQKRASAEKMGSLLNFNTESNNEFKPKYRILLTLNNVANRIQNLFQK